MKTMETNNTNDSGKPKLQEAGAFWKRTSKSGNTYLNGTIKTKDGESIPVIVFSNSNKVEGSNQPDYRVYFDTPRGDAPQAKRDNTKQVKSDEIPF
jgi:uncharacterized protein (DUF736 family)